MLYDNDADADGVTSAPSLLTLRKLLKLHLFPLSYILALSSKLFFSPCVVLVVAFVT